MEDIIRALLDVVRAQHSATEGTDEAPFDMNDIVDMAMNIVGRPDEADEAAEMVDSIQRLVETLAPDIFPPKTFEEMDDAERAASAFWEASMKSYPLASDSAWRSAPTSATVRYLCSMGPHSTVLTRCSGRATTIFVLLPSLTLTS